MASKKFLDKDGLKTTIESIAIKMNEKLDGKVSSISSSNTDFITVDNTDPVYPIISLNPTLIEKINILWDIAENGIKKENTPVPVIDYIEEKLVNLIPDASYSVNDIQMYTNNNGELTISNTWLNSTISVVKKASNISKEDSDVASVFVKARRAVPNVQASINSIVGVNDTMEYKSSTSDEWIPITIAGTTLTNLPEGDYNIRYKSTDSEFSGEIKTLSVTNAFVRVTNIEGIPSKIEQSTTDHIVEVSLDGIVIPSNATYQTIEWGITEPGGTVVTVTNNKLTAFNLGTFRLRARIDKGISEYSSYIQYFDIQVVPRGSL